MGSMPGSAYLRSLEVLTDQLGLQFPIETKDEFVAQVTTRVNQLEVAGRWYDAHFAAGLIPRFFFPLTDRADFERKATELIASRGLVDLQQSRSQ